jgi:hypothetical protein
LEERGVKEDYKNFVLRKWTDEEHWRKSRFANDGEKGFDMSNGSLPVRHSSGSTD